MTELDAGKMASQFGYNIGHPTKGPLTNQHSSPVCTIELSVIEVLTALAHCHSVSKWLKPTTK